MKKETEKEQRLLIWLAVIVTSAIVSATGVFVIERVLDSQLDTLGQETKVLGEQVELLDYETLGLQAKLLTFMQEQITEFESEHSVQKLAEVKKVKKIYNPLAGRYNSSMVESNYRFANTDSLPHGVTCVLPREFALYSF